ncbi:cell wall-binding repeat-containing protein [Leifsonia sp. F6_8S_P_1B]|uniref:Cell wall-binding repeat-containing protein n=1 Tax=Leifsonia williamsii TaxID=3035919 RepID=A0ABT8KFT1_9MICO|nr:cell wall-binding repeat-containing protein [Leifsonia williamsii]MDN4615877.1 cell wall-binding repeat-containing protein [Leifsonia williamsii]
MRSALLGAATAVVTLAALATAPLPASAANTYGVGGTITYAVPSSAAKTVVRLYPVSGTPAAAGGKYATTASGGHWGITGVAAGRYRVLFSASTGDNAANAAVWLGGTPYEDKARVIDVGRQATNDLAVTQPAAGSISGTLTLPTGQNDRRGVQAWLFNHDTGLYERAQGVTTGAVTSTGNYTVRGLAAGDYIVRFADRNGMNPRFATRYYPGGEYQWDSDQVTVTAGAERTGIDGSTGPWGWYSGRLAGADRFATSAAISSAYWAAGTSGDSRVVFVANGTAFPDALSASAAASVLGGPLLLSRQDSLPDTTWKELQRYKPSVVAVIGGTASIGDAVWKQLGRLGAVTKKEVSLVRLAGADRYETSRKVVDTVFGGAPVNSVFIATGTNFPDALVAGSAAGYRWGPLLLVNGSAGKLDAPTKALIASLSPSRIYIVGGVNSVSNGIQADLATLNRPEVLRLAGADRFGTAQAVNREVFPFADEAFVANALTFPDALSISAVAGSLGAPLLLAPPTCIPYGEVVDATALGVSTYWAVGGTASLSTAVTDLTMCDKGQYGMSSALSAEVGVPETGAVQPADPSTQIDRRTAAETRFGAGDAARPSADRLTTGG